ncbi:metal-sensitive transcriptional regulator [Exiguobacterium sp. ZOR0005]|uniref:metal-sensitive transcriptional regulator n=1 Tax=Exiguobacterium sp. ZOR0005 TaxID=1339226 RepID=UPI000462AE3F|nr:metal-sensitive transcriptional regulator [Exiguobacterium sp. ZOR0005]
MEEYMHEQPLVPRDDVEREALSKRLRRIEGQVRGIQKMVESDRYCVDILTQTSAIQAALKQVELQLLERHMRKCLVHASETEDMDPYIDELMTIVSRIKK